MPLVGAETLPRLSPYSSPGVMGPPSASTAVRERHHRRDGHRAGVGAAQLLEGGQRPVAPRFPRVVLEFVRFRYPQPVRNPGPGHHLAVLVGGDRFDRGGADVDADCHLFA